MSSTLGKEQTLSSPDERHEASCRPKSSSVLRSSQKGGRSRRSRGSEVLWLADLRQLRVDLSYFVIALLYWASSSAAHIYY